jgi:hypothetical protein
MRDRKAGGRVTGMSTTVRGGVLITRNTINEVYRSFRLLIGSIDATPVV